ncbi:hypothetical protein Hanom_Chr08g00693561 [Helianthus anomalus]
MLTPFFRRCPLAQKLTNFVFCVSKSCTICPLALAQLDFLVKNGLAHKDFLVISPFNVLLCNELLSRSTLSKTKK